MFLEGSRLNRHLDDRPGRDACLVETGFGTGLNFVVTAQHWLESSAANQSGARPKLHYIGIDSCPLTPEQARSIAATWPENMNLSGPLLANWPASVRGCHRLHWPDQHITLDLWWEDALAVLEELVERRQRWVDYWYLDGFAPAKNTDLWSPVLYDHMTSLSDTNARVATFTAAGDVRRGLIAAGFSVDKRPGFGRKRECLSGRLMTLPNPSNLATDLSATIAPTIDVQENRQRLRKTSPWDLNPAPIKPHHAVVVGAGLSGAFVARALADRGVRVTVLESDYIASGGSSNLQGITYTRPSKRFSALSDFAIASYLHATRLYSQLLNENASDLRPAGSALRGGIDGSQCGYVQLSDDHQTLDYLGQFVDRTLPFRCMNSEQLTQLLGVPCESSGLWFPDACWLNPEAVCRERLSHPGISVLEQHRVDTLSTDGNAWRVGCESTELTCDAVILASAQELTAHPWTDWLPLQVIRGQTTHLPASSLAHTPQIAICHEGYLPPPRQGIHCLGASYGPNDRALDERPSEHAQNMQKLQKALPGLRADYDLATLKGHVALRCTTADYLPVAGPVPDRESFNRHYKALGGRKTAVIDGPAPTIPNLWLIGGLGSRGLTAAPLASEVLVSQLCGEPPPVNRQLHRALSPARFLARGLIRGAPL